jgi:hypothetical protein
MPDNLVNIVFQAETAQMTAAFAAIEAEMAKLRTISIDGSGVSSVLAPLAEAKAEIQAINAKPIKIDVAPAIVGLKGVEAELEKVKLEVAEVNARPIRIFDSNAIQAPVGGAVAPQTTTVNWTQLAKDRAAAEAFMRGSVGKTAADFKPATDAQRAASVATEEASGRAEKSLARQLGGVRSLYSNVLMVAGAVYSLAKAWEAAAQAEAASRHLSAQTSPTIAKEIGAAAKSLNYSPAEYQGLALPLKVAGIHANNLKEMVTRIGEASRVSGVPVQALEQMIEKVQTGGHATWDDMKTLTLATDGATQHLADTFRTMAVNQLDYEQKFKAVSESNRKVIQDRQQKIAGQDAFAEKIGVGDSSFKAYIARGGFGGAGGNYSDQLAAGQARAKEEQRPRSYAELWGQTPEKGLATAEDKRYTEGIAQLAKEGDSTRSAVLNYIKAGKFDRSDVMSASGRGRSEAEQDRQLEERKTQEKESKDYEKAQRDLLVKGLNDFLLKATPAKTAEVAAQKGTPEGQWQHVSATVGDMKVSVGSALIAYTNAVVTAQPLQDLAAAVQTHLPNAAKDQAAQRLKEGGLDYDMIIPKYGPGQAQPSALPGPTSKEGGKVEDPTTHSLLEQILSIFKGS